MAATLNAANNALNQIYDLEIDRINKPNRPLPSGRLTMREAWMFTWIDLRARAGARVARRARRPARVFLDRRRRDRRDLRLLVPAAAHEAARHLGQRHDRDPARRAAEGGRLVVRQDDRRRRAVVSSATIFGLFLLGASTTKDFADMEGDARGGCRTLPIVYGVRRAAWMISPSFVVPFLLISVGASAGILTGNHVLLQLLAGGMTIYGVYVCYLMLRRPEDLAVEANHVSWAHMYRMMFVAQIGFALAYASSGCSVLTPTCSPVVDPH